VNDVLFVAVADSLHDLIEDGTNITQPRSISRVFFLILCQIHFKKLENQVIIE